VKFTSAVFGNNPGGGVSLGGSNVGGGGPDQCDAITSTAKLVPLDLYVLIDSSKSMNETTTAGSTKWQALSDAMTGFFKDPNSAEIVHILSGSCDHRRGDEWMKLKGGDTLRIPKDVPHMARAGDQPLLAMIVYDTPKRVMVPVAEDKK